VGKITAFQSDKKWLFIAISEMFLYLCALKIKTMDILELAKHNQQTAYQLLEDTGLIQA
jgi:hypothetical protein